MWGARAITARYGPAIALDGISLDIPPGEVTAVVGGDGAGKTTLLRALTGHVPLVAGRVEAPPAARIGFQPATSGVWRQLSVDENIEFAGNAYRIPASRLKARREALLGRAGLLEVGSRLGGQLSGGMRQKLGFCLALLHEPDLLLLDEPSTGVDPVSRVELWRLIAETAAGGTAVLMATTYLDEAERASRVLVLDGGRALGYGEPATIARTIPGRVLTSQERPGEADRGRTWRRGTAFHRWDPAAPPPEGTSGAPDLEDAVIVLTLAREQAVRPATQEGGGAHGE